MVAGDRPFGETDHSNRLLQGKRMEKGRGRHRGPRISLWSNHSLFLAGCRGLCMGIGRLSMSRRGGSMGLFGVFMSILVAPRIVFVGCGDVMSRCLCVVLRRIHVCLFCHYRFLFSEPWLMESTMSAPAPALSSRRTISPVATPHLLIRSTNFARRPACLPSGWS